MTITDRIDTLTDEGFQDPVIAAILGLEWTDLETYRTAGTLPTPTLDVAAGAIAGIERAGDAAAPAANGFVIYAKDNGSGKTEVMARFATGAPVAVAVQP